MSRIRGPYVRFCERDEAVTPHPTRCAFNIVFKYFTKLCVAKQVPFARLDKRIFPHFPMN